MKHLFNNYWNRFNEREQTALGLLCFSLIVWGVIEVIF